ncbi:MAG: ABC transporter substrate-binding protein [Desulfovibrionaceae bacterium]|nr:ABC transporter substrate-binding protein [Desulfovibrionaceae bacterium]
MKNPFSTLLARFLKSHQLMQFVIYGLAAGVLGGALWVAFQYVDPLPPGKVSILSGGPDGAYYGFANRYADYFAGQGYELEVIQTKGSMDNLSRLADPESTASAALMQGGIAEPGDLEGLESLGSVYYEPVWLFHKKGLKLKGLTNLKGRTIAVGPDGSGTAYLVRTLLAENGVTDETATLLPEGSGTAADKLVRGEIDALFTIAGLDSAAVRRLAGETGKVAIYSFKRADTYVRKHHYLTKLTLPVGGLDLVRDQPAKEITLLAPTANLVVKEDLHAAIKYLFLLAATEAHGKGDMFDGPGQFPNGRATLFPLGDEAESFYANGPPLLMRYLPFQIAITVERLKILLIPLLTLLFPLFKITPPAYRWQIRRRIFKWYKQLKALDLKAYDLTDKDEARRMLHQLEVMDRMVLDTSVPLSYTDYIYSLRLHIRMIQQRMRKMVGEEDADQDSIA